MCGIAGFWSSFPSADEARARVRAMTRVMVHRGPDGDGEHIDFEKGLAMGHCRLSIIDLHTGSQPILGPMGNEILTVNGEFYGYKKIRMELECEGARFRTKSDSEIALHLYRKMGLSFVDSLRGEFAFALYDGKEERLVLVRDRFGIKPLFYYLTENGVVWGSEVKAVLEHPDVPRRLDSKALLHQMMHTMVPGTSAFAGVQAVKPGHMLIFKRKSGKLELREQRYWDMEFPTAGDHADPKETEKPIRDVRDSLIEAVGLRLEADVPVGCYLSGGIDSCSMLGLASAAQQSPVKAFTISFDESAYDEAAIATEMAERVGADQELLNLKGEDLYGDNYRQTLWHAERTFYNTLGVAKWCMSRRVHQLGYKVVVTGEGSDELFGGYPAFKRDALRHGITTGSDRDASLRKLEESNKLFRGAILPEQDMAHPAWDALCGFTPTWIQPWMQALEWARPLLHPDIREELGGYDPLEALADSIDKSAVKSRHPLDIAQYTWSKTMLECQILNWGGDRVDMAHSMESRPAFLDHEVARIAVGITPDLRVHQGTEKWVLREAMKNVLPEVLYKREKFAFMAPPAHLGQAKRLALKSLVDEHLNPTAVKSAGLFDSAAVSAFLQRYTNSTDAVELVRLDVLMNHLLCAQLLHEQFVATGN
jgi:asparagine synthase (glutamine-hydrolysing)